MCVNVIIIGSLYLEYNLQELFSSFEIGCLNLVGGVGGKMWSMATL